MATGDKHINIQEQMLIFTTDLEQHFFDFLYEQVRSYIKYSFPQSGLFSTYGNLTSVTANTFNVSYLEGLWNIGVWAQLPIQNNIPFENFTGVSYYIGAKFVEVVTGCNINILKGSPEYTEYEEQIGNIGNPDLIVDNIYNLIIVVDSVTETGVNNSGRNIKIYLNEPKTTTNDWCEECIVHYGTYGGLFPSDVNYIETVSILGQTVNKVNLVSEEYVCYMQGYSVFKNIDLSDRITYADIIYLGRLIGNYGGVASVDLTNLVTFTHPVGELAFIRDYVGKPYLGPLMPSYASLLYINQGDNLVDAVSDLDSALSEGAADGGVIGNSVADRAESLGRRAESQGVSDNSLAKYAETMASKAESKAGASDPVIFLAHSVAVRALSLCTEIAGINEIKLGSHHVTKDFGHVISTTGNMLITTHQWYNKRPGQIRLHFYYGWANAVGVAVYFRVYVNNTIIWSYYGSGSNPIGYPPRAITLDLDVEINHDIKLVCGWVGTSPNKPLTFMGEVCIYADNPNMLFLPSRERSINALPYYSVDLENMPALYAEGYEDISYTDVYDKTPATTAVQELWTTLKEFNIHRPGSFIITVQAKRYNNYTSGLIRVLQANMTEMPLYRTGGVLWGWGATHGNLYPSWSYYHFVINMIDVGAWPVNYKIQVYKPAGWNTIEVRGVYVRCLNPTRCSIY